MRHPRKLRNGARYHVSARANRKEMILDTSGMKALFIDVLERAKRRYAFRIENFCVMGNHYHLIIQPVQDTSLSRIMQWIMSVFAMEYNRILGVSGHVWGERFYSRIIDSLHEFLKIFEYIDENPVKAGLARTAESWLWCGKRHRLSNCRKILDPLPLWLSQFIVSECPSILSKPNKPL